PKTITINIASVAVGISSTGIIYTASGATTATGGACDVTARVGDTIIFTASALHPLRFDAGTTTCIYAGVTANQTYPVTATGTYYFHCQNHAAGCSAGAL